MNYRHIYHAGNFADVIKHVTLIVLLRSLQRKESPFCFLDTHAGIGLYDLLSEQTQKKQEYRSGIEKLWLCNPSSLPTELQEYLNIIKKFNATTACHFYPGSPTIAQTCLRDDDQMILCELHQADYQQLKNNSVFWKRKNVAIHHMDGYLGMKAFLPPKQNRGLVLIDPPFEIDNEFEKIFHSLQHALKHWRTGHFMVWYPIKNQDAVRDFYNKIKTLQCEKLTMHFSLKNNVEVGKLASCGILLIHPPWQVKEIMDSISPALSSVLEVTLSMAHLE